MKKNQEEELFIKKFKENFYEKFGYVPVIIPINSETEFYKPLMTLDELEKYFIPFTPKSKYRVLSIRSKERFRDLVYLRFIFAFLARKMGYTIIAIGKYLNKHHTSVLHYECAFHNEMQTSETFRKQYYKIYTYIKNNYTPNDKLSAMVYFDKVWDKSKSTILS